MASTRSKLDEIVASFSTLEDPRSHINRRHPLPSILVIAVLAVLAGAAGPTAIARWAKLKEDLLTGILDLPHGIPGKDVFRRVLMTAQARGLRGRLQRLDRPPPRRGHRRDGRRAADHLPRRQVGPPQPRREERPRPPARRHRLGRRIRAGVGPAGLRREVQRDHRDPRAAARRSTSAAAS